ncbi:MAG: VOC family protein [SAR202 cluster bacterium]|nr:VOC family protein [SAR202 cluster bacterium]
MTVTAYHTGFSVSDLQRSIKFYTEGIGLECEDVRDLSGPGLDSVVGYKGATIKAAFLVGDDGQILELLQYVNPPSKPRQKDQQYERYWAGAAHLGFFVDDAKAAFDRCVKLGGKVLNPLIEAFDGVWACYMQDPDGNWFEIVQDNRHNRAPFVIRQNRTIPWKKQK